MIPISHQLNDDNTFGLPCTARHYVAISTPHQLSVLPGLLSTLPEPLILGGGSNLLLPPVLERTVLHIKSKGIEVIDETEHSITLNVQAGEIWHDFVSYTVERGWYGLENLALIPGTVGASPVQNIGAYGVEVKDLIRSVEVFNLKTGAYKELSRDECLFSYRDSLFKRTDSPWLITSVAFTLNKKWQPNIAYPDVQNELKSYDSSALTAKNVFNAICAIRQRKLPDPKIQGNAGSFFKNPIISIGQLAHLQQCFPGIVSYPTTDPQQVKLAAAWLIDQTGWKGKNLGKVGVHERQALVLVNQGNATLKDVLRLAQNIQHDVFNTFSVQLDIEPMICE